MRLALIIGARPQIIKSASIIHEAVKNPEIELYIIHTGQHYDYMMSKMFFEELNLPEPIFNLNVGSGSHAKQTAKMMMRIEKVISKIKPEAAIIPGDANSALAGCLALTKLLIPTCHVESGLRSYDMSMPEEINRRLADHCSTILFAPTKTAYRNLIKEGINRDYVFLVGDTMYDEFLKLRNKIDESEVLIKLNVNPNDYALLTLHRQENVDNAYRLRRIVEAIVQLSNDVKIVFPIHPRTYKRLKRTRLINKLSGRNIVLTRPLGYLDMLKIEKEAKLILTDSGGVQKEAYWFSKPCLTLRYNTEWIETVIYGVNTLVGTETEYIVSKAKEILNSSLKYDNLPKIFGDGNASFKILNILMDLYYSNKLKIHTSNMVNYRIN
ncbi:MAG: UDP-N-acetylglucosamine 2-epimerase (non-hydrolyzing) [Candidatus Methanomethylicia archaeon]